MIVGRTRKTGEEDSALKWTFIDWQWTSHSTVKAAIRTRSEVDLHGDPMNSFNCMPCLLSWEYFVVYQYSFSLGAAFLSSFAHHNTSSRECAACSFVYSVLVVWFVQRQSQWDSGPSGADMRCILPGCGGGRWVLCLHQINGKQACKTKTIVFRPTTDEPMSSGAGV